MKQVKRTKLRQAEFERDEAKRETKRLRDVIKQGDPRVLEFLKHQYRLSDANDASFVKHLEDTIFAVPPS